MLTFLLSIVSVFTGYAQVDMATAMQMAKTAKPGDVITIADGVYQNVELSFVVKGDSAKPIIIKAQTPGGVFISGQSSLRMAGIGLQIEGFHFTNGYAPKGAVIEFRSGNEVANHCRITNCAIDDFSPPSRETENSWVLLYGRHNRFDHNSIVGKLNAGVTLAVILDEERNIENHHSIDHNYFGERPNLGSNGGETIRVGTSQSSLLSSRTIIRNNFFEWCDGEVEVVSIKSCDNEIRSNTFYECAGVLALRHGHRNKVFSNAFIGNHKPNTGGVRVINEGHRIVGNRFENLTGSRFFAALAVMNAVPNSLPNRYHQVKDVDIDFNTFSNCDHIEFCVGKDNERTLPPLNVTFSNNYILSRSKNFYTAYDDISGFHFKNNTIKTTDSRLAATTLSKTITGLAVSDPKGYPKEDTGADWYRKGERPKKKQYGKRTIIPPSQNSLHQAVLSSSESDIIQLTEGEYLIDAPIEIKTHLRLQAAPDLKTKPVIRYNGTKGKVSMFTIADDGVLELDGIAFNGDAFDGKASPTSAIAPAPVMRTHYSATVNNCEFYNFTESSFAPFKATKGTYADTLRFTNCLFRDMSGDAISLAAEKQDDGRYNAEYVEVKNCAFYKVLGYAVDLYRGGSDESTTGPAIVVDHCVLEDVNNKERGAGMRLYGVQNVVVKNTSFANTGRGGASIKFDETTWDKIAVTNCNLFNSGRISSFWGKVVSGPMHNIKPGYKASTAYDFSLAAGSPLMSKGSDGKAIGLIGSASTSTTKTKTISTR